MWLVDLKKLFVTSVKVWRRCAGTRHSNKNTLQLRGQPDVSFPPRMHGFSCNVALSIYESTTPLECSCHESTGCPSAFAKVYIGLHRHRIRPVQSPAFTQARLTVHQSAIKPSWCAGRGQIMHHELHDRKIRIAADSVQADNHAILPVHPPPCPQKCGRLPDDAPLCVVYQQTTAAYIEKRALLYGNLPPQGHHF